MLLNYLVRVVVFVVFVEGGGEQKTKKSWIKGMVGNMPLPEG